MPKFIEVCEDKTRKYCYLNIECISYVEEQADGTAIIGMLSVHSNYHSSTGDVIYTSETYRNIKDMINNA